MVKCLPCPSKGKHTVDHRLQAGSGPCTHKVFQHRPITHSDRTDDCTAPFEMEIVNSRIVTTQEPDQHNLSTPANSIERLIDRRRTADFNDTVHACSTSDVILDVSPQFGISL